MSKLVVDNSAEVGRISLQWVTNCSLLLWANTTDDESTKVQLHNYLNLGQVNSTSNSDYSGLMNVENVENPINVRGSKGIYQNVQYQDVQWNRDLLFCFLKAVTSNAYLNKSKM